MAWDTKYKGWVDYFYPIMTKTQAQIHFSHYMVVRNQFYVID